MLFCRSVNAGHGRNKHLRNSRVKDLAVPRKVSDRVTEIYFIDSQGTPMSNQNANGNASLRESLFKMPTSNQKATGNASLRQG